jgi:hypothetical protein
MTGTDGPTLPDDPARPVQWPLELLADLHAGALTERVAARLYPRVTADPQARAVLTALDNTVADLAALPTRRPAPMPDAVAQRLDAALAAETLAAETRVIETRAAETRVIETRAAETRGLATGPGSPWVTRHRAALIPAAEGMRAGWRSRWIRWVGAGVLAAAVIGVAVLGVQTGVITGTTPRAGDALGAANVSPAAPLVLSGNDLGGALNHTLGTRDYGPLSRSETLRRCLDTNDVPVRDEPLGAREVILDGRRGVLLVLPTTRIAQFRLLVVGSDCGLGRPSRMADAVVGSR